MGFYLKIFFTVYSTAVCTVCTHTCSPTNAVTLFEWFDRTKGCKNKAHIHANVKYNHLSVLRTGTLTTCYIIFSLCIVSRVSSITSFTGNSWTFHWSLTPPVLLKRKTAFVYFINACFVCVINHIISTILAHACAALSDNTCVGVQSLMSVV